MREYTEPKAIIVRFEEYDIITASGEDGDMEYTLPFPPTTEPEPGPEEPLLPPKWK